MIAPPRSRIKGTAALVHRNGPVRLTSSTRFQSVSEVSISGAKTATPALLINASSRPKRRSRPTKASATAFSSATSQSSPSVWSGELSAFTLLRKSSRSIEQCHAPALGKEMPGDRKSDAARGAGHQRDLLLRSAHGCSIVIIRKKLALRNEPNVRIGALAQKLGVGFFTSSDEGQQCDEGQRPLAKSDRTMASGRGNAHAGVGEKRRGSTVRLRAMGRA